MAARSRSISLISSVDFLRGADAAQLGRLADSAKYLHLQPGDSVFKAGDQGEGMYIVSTGHLSATIDGSGEVASYAAGGFFGELALLNDNLRRAAVTATEFTVIISIDRRLFQRVCGDAAALLSEYANERYGLDV
jgi:CRP-like cAMP-binding protein